LKGHETQRMVSENNPRSSLTRQEQFNLLCFPFLKHHVTRAGIGTKCDAATAPAAPAVTLMFNMIYRF
jgi:hypothetical protein